MYKDLITAALSPKGLDSPTTTKAITAMAKGELTPIQQAAILMALRAKGEQPHHLIAAAKAMAGFMKPVASPAPCLDSCGTGGDGLGTYNISTAAALITAASGVMVAKHGNKAMSSKCGSADVLAALGVKTDLTPPEAEAHLQRHNFVFLAAPVYHPAMANVAEARQALATRTIFNLIGPLLNPAKATYRVLGVFAANWMEPMAMALASLGVKRAWVLHSQNGADEITLAAQTTVVEVAGGKISKPFIIDPEELGFSPQPLATIKGGDAQHNAAALAEVLKNKPSVYAQTAVLNAAACLVVAERAATLAEGIDIANQTLATGKGQKLLESLRQ